jgi:ribosome-binding factor A
MSREFPRASRLADQIQRDLSETIRSELKDPRVGMITITAVEVSRDLSHARVFVSALAGAEAMEETLHALRRAAGFLRSRLAHSLTSRTVPELQFVYDESVERGARLSRLIDEANQPPAGSDTDPA